MPAAGNRLSALRAKVLKHLRPRFFRFIVFECDLTRPLVDVPNPPDVVVERLGRGDVQAACAGVTDREMVDRLRLAAVPGHICYLARVRGQAAGTLVVGPGPIICRKRLVLRLRPDERYGMSGYVLPEFRGQKLFQILKSRACRDQQAAGIRRIYSMVAEKNAPSIRAQLNLGYVPVFRFTAMAWMLLNILGPRLPVAPVPVKPSADFAPPEDEG